MEFDYRFLIIAFLSSFNSPASEISGIGGVGFLKSSGSFSGPVTLSSTRSCTFTRERESSFNEHGDEV